jgi:nucleotide-binding universal stress UspA family protein
MKDSSLCRQASLPDRRGSLLRFSLAIMLTIAMGTASFPALASETMPRGSDTYSEPSEPIPPFPENENPDQAVLNPIGIVLASVFVIFMANLFRWMFRVPPHLPYVVVKARHSVSALRRILVPVGERLASSRAVELACRLGEAQKAEIILVYVIEVPFTLSLNAPLASEQAKGEEILNIAGEIVGHHGLPAQMKVIPHRTEWGGILRMAREEAVDAIVMNAGTGPGAMEGVGRAANELLKRAECEVILDKAPWRA